MYCKHCGKPVTNGARFCSSCGTPINTDVQNVSDRPQNSTSICKSQQSGLVIMVIIGAVLLCIIMLFICIGALRNKTKSNHNNSLTENSYSQKNEKSSNQISIDKDSLSTKYGVISNININELDTLITQRTLNITADFSAYEENGPDRYAYLITVTTYDSSNKALRSSYLMTPEIAGGETASCSGSIHIPKDAEIDHISITDITKTR